MANTSDVMTTVGGDVRPPEFNPAFPLELLYPDPENHRRGGLGDLTSLTESIRADGVDTPLKVTPHPRAPMGMWLIVSGHRRQAAATAAGRTTVPVVIEFGPNPLGGLADDDVDKKRARENLEREDLTASEEAWIYEQRARKTGESDAIVAAFYGKSQGHVTKRRALLRLPEKALEAVDRGGKEGGIGSGDGYLLSQLMVHERGEEVVIELLDRHLDGSLGISLADAIGDAKRRLGIESKTVGRRGNRSAEDDSEPATPVAAPAPTSAATVTTPTPDVPVLPAPRPRRQIVSYDQRSEVVLRPRISGRTYQRIVDLSLHGGRGRPGFVHWLSQFIETHVAELAAKLEADEAAPAEADPAITEE